MNKMKISDVILSIIPLIPNVLIVSRISDKYTLSLLLWSLIISLIAFLLVNTLVPKVAGYTLKRSICGKDMGKKGTINESKDIPEALGLVSGVVYLICTIMNQLSYANNLQQLVIYNSALFSICFMIFLGFTDDILDLKWRYKLILPTIASLPLVSIYSGSTALFVPSGLRFLLWSVNESRLTPIGAFIDRFVTVDTEAKGAIIELSFVFLIYMGLLAVFCTNAINILAGINGLECGQSYIIASSILFFKLYESSIEGGGISEEKVFVILMVMPFIGTALGLLRHNWYPAQVFVGDTFCYFAGMTFAVIGIHGHFSKTILLLFLPQVINFLYSIPQLFKIGGVPCPRHRLPRVDPNTRLLHASTFPCKKNELKLLKVKSDDIECPNMTLLCLMLRVFGPMKERTLTVAMLTLQGISSVLAFYIRYRLFEDKQGGGVAAVNNNYDIR